MHPTRSPGWLSPLCLWVERRLGQERQRELKKRYLLILLLGSFLLLAYDSATLPARIDTLWSVKLNGDITHASIYTDPVHGRVVAVAVMQNVYDPSLSKLKHSYTRIALIDQDGREVGNLVEVEGSVGDLIYLPSQSDPDAVVLIPLRYMHGEVHILEMEGQTPRLPELFDAQIIPGKEANWTFSPNQIDSAQVGKENLLVGYCEEGPSILSAYLYNGTVNRLWTYNLRTDDISAHILTGSGNEAMIGVVGSDGAWLFHPNGTLVESLNITTWVRRDHLQGVETSGTRLSVDPYHIAWGRGVGGFRLSVTDEAKGDTESLLMVADHLLRIWAAFPVSERRYADPIFLEDVDRMMMGGQCRDLGGSVLWLRRRMPDVVYSDLGGDGIGEVLTTKPGLFASRGRILVYNTEGVVVARGNLRPGRSPVFGTAGWIGLAVGDLDEQPGQEILFYAGDKISLLKPGKGPSLLRFALEAGLASLFLVLFLVVLHLDGSQPFYTGITRIKGLIRRLGVFPGSRRPGSAGGDEIGGSGGRARMVGHEAYKVCRCGARNAVEAPMCVECGRQLRIPAKEEAPDLSIRGRISRLGLVLGVVGLGIFWVTPVIWGVEPHGLLVPVRSIFSVLSPAVPFSPWSYVPFVLVFVGLSLIYLESRALLGAGVILLSSVATGWLVARGESVSLLPLALVTVSGALELVQKARQMQLSLLSRGGRVYLAGLAVLLSLVVVACVYLYTPRVDAFLGDYGYREAERVLAEGVANVTLLVGNKGMVKVIGLEAVVWVDPPCILKIQDATRLASGEFSYRCQALPPGTFASLLLEVECPDPTIGSTVIHVNLLHRGLKKRKLVLRLER